MDIFLGLFSNPFLILAASDITKKNYYPGKSLYFWIFSIMLFYSYYLYKNKTLCFPYLSKTFYKSSLINFAILYFTYIGINLIYDRNQIDTKEQTIQLNELMEKDSILYFQANNNFTSHIAHEAYINNHFLIPEYWKINGKIIKRDDYTIQNFYYDHLDFTDSAYVQMGYFGLGLYNYKIDSLKKSLYYFNKIAQNPIQYSNYYRGELLKKLNDTTQAIEAFNKELLFKNKFYEPSLSQLIKLYEGREQYLELTNLVKLKGSKNLFSNKLILKLYLKTKDLTNYYSDLFVLILGNSNWLTILAAFVIMIVWMLYVVRIDIFEKEKILPLILTVCLGMGSLFLIFLLSDYGEVILGYNDKFTWRNLYYFVIKVGLVEESAKALPLILVIIIFKKRINEPYDYILFGCMSALGFSFIENLLYFQQNLSGVIYSRALTTVPAHMIGSSIVGYSFVLSRYRFNNFPIFISLPIFIIIAAIMHGLYDFWAFTHTLSIFVFHFLISVTLWLIIINNSINNSPLFSYKLKFKSENMQLYLSVALTSILALQYILLFLDQGPIQANASLNNTLFIGGLFIIYYSDKLTNVDLVKGYWNTFHFKSIADKRRSTPFNFKMFFIRLISGDIITHNFVGNTILIQSNEENTALIQIFHHIEKAKIVDRLVITCILQKTGDEYQDPYWFKIKTNMPIIPGASLEYFVRFSDDRPSFDKSKKLIAYLFCYKNLAITDGEIKHRNELRALGKVNIIQA